MALPKEPRQKMINIMYLVLTALLALNVSSEILNAFKVVDKSLMTSNTNISGANGTLYKSLLSKVADPVTSAKATIWNAKAQQAKTLSDDLNTYIEGIKKQLKEEAGLTLEAGQEKFKEDDLEAATRLFGNGEGGKNLGPQLEQKLKDYKAAMLAIDPAEIGKEFANSLSVDGAPAVGQDGTVKAFTDAYFHMTPTVAALTLLSKFQNNVKNSENQVVTYCHNKIGAVEVRPDKFSVLVGQSANYVMPGQEVEITAGVGAYSSKALPQINIAGAGVPVVDGKGTYKFQATGAGKQSKSITVTYKDLDNISHTETKTVEYTIGTPGGAAVMLDKMNVFYIGVPNPITIGSPAGWDKTTVSMNGGTISGSGSNRTVTVGQLGPASITVNADGKPSTFNYRTKRIPDPKFKVGSGKARVPAVEFKNQQFCRADLGDDFLFDLKFNVVSATVYFSGAGFTSTQVGTINGNGLGSLANFIAKCQPGSSITFVNIKVQGPDGVRVIDEASIALY
jgi:gliding motility-associated protein GldM